MSRRRQQRRDRRYDTSVRRPTSQRQQRRVNVVLVACGVLAALLFCAAIWHLVSDVMTDLVVFMPPGHAASKQWIGELREAGFWVDVVEDHDPQVTRHSLHVPDRFSGQPTTLTVNPSRYVISGPVPADVIERLLDEQPNILGVAVLQTDAPGAPAQVWAFSREGRVMAYAPGQSKNAK